MCDKFKKSLYIKIRRLFLALPEILKTLSKYKKALESHFLWNNLEMIRSY